MATWLRSRPNSHFQQNCRSQLCIGHRLCHFSLVQEYILAVKSGLARSRPDYVKAMHVILKHDAANKDPSTEKSDKRLPNIPCMSLIMKGVTLVHLSIQYSNLLSLLHCLSKSILLIKPQSTPGPSPHSQYTTFRLNTPNMPSLAANPTMSTTTTRRSGQHPPRQSEPITAADIHAECEIEQEAIVSYNLHTGPIIASDSNQINRFTRGLAARRASQTIRRSTSESSSSTSSSDVVDFALSGQRTGPSHPVLPRHRRFASPTSSLGILSSSAIRRVPSTDRGLSHASDLDILRAENEALRRRVRMLEEKSRAICREISLKLDGKM